MQTTACKIKKNKNFIVAFILLLRWEEMLLVYCSVNGLFSLNGDGVCIIYSLNGPNNGKQVINVYLFFQINIISFTTCLGKNC